MNKQTPFLFLLSFLCVQAQEYHVDTSQGKIHVYDSQTAGPAVLFIHGNSASGRIFKKQFDALGKQHRLIAVDLPGHGKSDSAKSMETYSFPGYARVINEAIKQLRVKDLSVIGWSLGGHIALELSLLRSDITGILITGTPPIKLTPEGIKKGFKPFDGLSLLGSPEKFTKEQATRFMELGGIQTTAADARGIVEDAMHTDGNARKHMFASITNGVGSDETEIVKAMKVPLAIVAGEKDCGINNEYITRLSYGNLWGGKMHVIPDAGHAVFWEHSAEFNAIALEFLHSINEK